MTKCSIETLKLAPRTSDFLELKKLTSIFCSLSPKLPRVHVGLHHNANEKN